MVEQSLAVIGATFVDDETRFYVLESRSGGTADIHFRPIDA